MIGLNLLHWMNFLIEVENGICLRELYKKTDISISHINKISQFLEYEKIIKSQMDGRKRIMILTPKGKKIQECLQKIKYELNKNETE